MVYEKIVHWFDDARTKTLSELGVLPSKDDNVVSSFLRDNKFLLFSWNQFNSLGVGLTQLYNRVVVLNHKRREVFKLDNKEFDFRSPNNGFPIRLHRNFY